MIVLDFAKVIDRTLLRTDDVSEVKLQATDREYWNRKASKLTVDLADSVLEIINEVAGSPYSLNYNKFYIGLSNGIRSTNFVIVRPKKKFIRVWLRLARPDDWIASIENEGLNSSRQDGGIEVYVEPKEFSKHKESLSTLIQAACQEFEQ